MGLLCPQVSLVFNNSSVLDCWDYIQTLGTFFHWMSFNLILSSVASGLDAQQQPLKMFSLLLVTWHLTSICAVLMVFIPIASSMWWLPGFPHEISSFPWELARTLWGSTSKLCIHPTYHPCSSVCLCVCLQTYVPHYSQCYYYFSGCSNCPWFGIHFSKFLCPFDSFSEYFPCFLDQDSPLGCYVPVSGSAISPRNRHNLLENGI